MKKVQTEYKENILPTRAVRQWNGLPGEAVQLPSLGALKTQLYKALRNLVWAQSWLCFEQELVLETFWGAFQTGFSYGAEKKLIS